MTENKSDKITYVDFKTLAKNKEKKSYQNGSFHTNPVIERLFKLVHTKLSSGKDDYKSFTEFKPDDFV